jgi:hypothetical protein
VFPRLSAPAGKMSIKGIGLDVVEDLDAPS